MSEKRVEFQNFKTSILTQTYQERVLDWIESGDIILKKLIFIENHTEIKYVHHVLHNNKKKENVSNILLMVKNYKVVDIWILHVVKNLKKRLMNT